MINKIEMHKRICSELNEIYEAKNHDYGDSFAKVRKEVGTNAILVRLYDKIGRLSTLLNGADQKVKTESIDDCFMDLANYCILELIEREADRYTVPFDTTDIDEETLRKTLANNDVTPIRPCYGETEEITVPIAMKVLTKDLKKDKAPGSNYYGWQSSIACTIMDNSNIPHDKANDIAVKFLELFIS